ncbi:MAG: S8 family serine peptidase [Bacteroidales bacterium]|nr:S8 family serine peptidase [Bacteroidales bacterium]
MKKKIFISLVFLITLQVLNSQNIFIYHPNGEKEYFVETDSLFQIKFLKEPDISLKNQLNLFSDIKNEQRTPARIVVKFNREEERTLSMLRSNKSIKYINQSLKNNKGSILIPTDKIMVKIKSGNSLSGILQKLNISYESFRKLGSEANSFLITLLDGNSITIANKLFESGFFEISQPSFTSFEGIQNPFYPNQWGLNNTGQNNGTSGIDINAPEVWSITRGDNNIRIAVIDQGVDLSHPDLANNLLLGFDATDGTVGGANGNCTGNDAHGTCCAGIIGSVNNTIGTIGVAPHCGIIPIRVTYTQNGREIWDDDWTVSAMYHAWAVSNADVVSCSWRQNHVIPLLDAEINNALTQGRQGRGCIVIFAAGNFNSSISYPANSNPSILAIGAMSQCGERKRSSSNVLETNPGVSADPLGVSCDEEKWWGSNFGSQLDIVAPGVKIYTTDIHGNAGYNPPQQGSDISNRDYTSLFNGTSAATPHVAGVAALMLSVRPDLTGQQVRDIIEQTAQKVGGYPYFTTSGRPNGTWHQEMGYGLVDAYAAVKAVAPRISGPSTICDQGTYAITNFPKGASVSWRIIGLNIVSGQGTPSITLARSPNSSGFLAVVQAYITVGRNSIIRLNKDGVFIGTQVPNVLLCPVDPQAPGTVGSAVSYGYTGMNYWLYAKGESTNPSDYRWKIYPDEPFTLPQVFTGKKISFSRSEPGNYTVSLQYNGECGWSREEFSIIEIVGGRSINLVPNPASNIVTVSLTDRQPENLDVPVSLTNITGSYLIQLWSPLGLVKQVTTDKAKYQLDLSGVTSGFYYVHVIKDRKTYRQQLVVK